MSIELILLAIPGKTGAELGRMAENADRAIRAALPVRAAEARRVRVAIDRELDSRVTRDAAVRAAEVQRLGGLPMALRVAEVFRALPPTLTEEKAIRALMENPGSTSADLSRACGTAGQIWHNWFGSMCRDRAHLLGPLARPEGAPVGWQSLILADYDRATGRWTLKPAAMAAFEDCGFGTAPGVGRAD